MYSKREVNLVTLFFTTIIFVLINVFYLKVEDMLKNIEKQENINNQKVIEEVIENKVVNSGNEECKEERIEEDNAIEVTEIEEWEIVIPKLDLVASVKEGVNANVINKSVGHFEQTSLFKGNVGLAAHNRGYAMNFFQDIKNLVKNDIIVYRINEKERQYAVQTVTIIDETDFSYLENTEDNRITLITCVKNNSEHRICVQAIEMT